MDYLFQDGGKPKKTKSKTKTSTKSKTGSKTKSSSKTGTKSSTKTSSKTTKSKSSSKKGGNFLGAVGDLVAPTGWGPFATAAGLLALDRADSALRRGKSEKSSAKKMSGGGGGEIRRTPINNPYPGRKGNPFTLLKNFKTPNEITKEEYNKYWSNQVNNIRYYDKDYIKFKDITIPKQTYDEIKNICIEKQRARTNSNRPKYSSISVAMQNGISDTLRKVYWDHIIFELYKQTIELNNGIFSIEKIKSAPFFQDI